MDCNDAKAMIFDSVRGRLASEERAALDEHVAGCEACAHELRAEQALTDALTNRLPKSKAPPSLLRKLQRQPSLAPSARVRPAWWSTLAAAAALFALSVSGWFAYRSAPMRDGEALTREAINDHLRITFSEHPIEVASGGIHQVKPWFAGKLDFAPVVRFSGDDDFPLVGGSVAYFIDRKAAAFVFQRRLHKITLLVFPVDGLPWPRSPTRSERGFNVLMWQANGLGYALVSDVDAAELSALAERLSVKN
jgi:anti-sigma factor RsiW